MRLVVFLFALAFAAAVVAGVRPLSSKDVSLMLRSGYSSEDVLREIAQRRVTDRPDPATKKSLVDFGASPRLLSVLESGEFQVDTATAERAREEETKASAQQEAEAEKTFRHATEVLKEQRSRPVMRPSLGGSLVSLFKDKLVRCRDGTIQAADSSALESKKLIAFYYSAHWCAPCRKFTPQLVDYYNRVRAEHPEFELIFVSFDKSRFNWETYMRDTKMPWLAIDFDQLGGFAQLKQLGGESIPSLLVLDDQSQIVASSYDGQGYVGPQSALATLDKIFAQGPPFAQAR
jgi:nucleoredoxin